LASLIKDPPSYIEVKKYDKKNKWFKIKYADGDEEDLNLDELKKVLVVKPKKKPTTEIRKNV